MWCSTVECLVMHTLSLLAAPLTAVAQQTAPVPRIGVVRTGSPLPAEQEAFRQGLRDGGDLAGQPVTLEDRHAGGYPAHLPALVAALVRLPVAELLTIGPAAPQAAQQATATIPLVAHDLESDPVQRGYAAPLAQPGGTITGGFLDMPELVGKWLELRKAVRPQLARVTVLWDPATGAVQRDAAHAAAHRVGIALPTLAGCTEVECAPAFTAIPHAPPDAVRVLGSPLMRRNSKRMADVATHSRLPALSPCRDFPEVVGLMAYGPSMPAMFRRCGVQVGQMRQGVQPGDVPMERPQKFDLVRHLQTAQVWVSLFPRRSWWGRTQYARRGGQRGGVGWGSERTEHTKGGAPRERVRPQPNQALGFSKRVRSPSSATVVTATVHWTPRRAWRASTTGAKRQVFPCSWRACSRRCKRSLGSVTVWTSS